MKQIITVFFLLLISLSGMAQEFPPVPDPARLVNDYTATLSKEQTATLETKLVAYYDSTSTQIAIVMISSLDGYPIDDYAIELGERWGIGSKGKDNGVLIFVAKDDRKIFIPVGYGMEGVLTDGLIKRIIENDIKPAFREGNYYLGFDRATDTMFRLAAGEHVYDEPKQNPVPVILIIGGILLIFVFIIIAAVKSAKTYAAVNGLDFWTAWQILNQASRSHHGTWGGFSGRGGSSGGWGGGGGFGGFGGGSFGGGGAGGSW
jgi:uncharacterized protein